MSAHATALALINRLTTSGWRDAPSQIAQLESACLSLLGYSSVAEFLADEQIHITIVLIHAGNATRWQKSLQDNPVLAKKYTAKAEDPRGFALIENLLPPTQTNQAPNQLPVISYAYYGVQPLVSRPDGQSLAGRRHITFHRWPRDAERFTEAAYWMHVPTQTIIPPANSPINPSGHGAVMCQLLPNLGDAGIIITQFGSDPVSRNTVILSALVLRALTVAKRPIGVILPTAPDGAYPVAIDESGIIRSLQHNKLGTLSESSQLPTAHLTAGGSNVGIRAYHAPMLLPILQQAQALYERTGHYTHSGSEFSLDHVDALLAATNNCRQLFIAQPAEATPAKDITKLVDFLAAERHLLNPTSATSAAPTVKEALVAAIAFLESHKIAGARLDAEILLAYTLHTNRAWIKAHDDAVLNHFQVADFESMISRRSEHIPVVHLTGTREFYGLDMAITPDVLTPRVETEAMVDWAIKYAPIGSSLIDIGTGSGAIAVAISVNRPDLAVTATDISQKELGVAQKNAKIHGADLTFVQSDLWNKVNGRFHTIVTNLPYLRDDADLMPEVRREPAVALFGGADGLDLYRKFLAGLPQHLEPGGRLFTECDPWQHTDLIAEAAKYGLTPIEQGYFILGFQLTRS